MANFGEAGQSEIVSNVTGKEAVNISQLKMFAESLAASGGSGSEWEFLWLTIEPGEKVRIGMFDIQNNSPTNNKYTLRAAVNNNFFFLTAIYDAYGNTGGSGRTFVVSSEGRTVYSPFHNGQSNYPMAEIYDSFTEYKMTNVVGVYPSGQTMVFTMPSQKSSAFIWSFIPLVAAESYSEGEVIS